MTDKLRYDDRYIRGVLERVKTIAAVGMSANDMRPSYFAMLYLQQKGYRMIPINPRYAGETILGETVLASLDDLPAPPDMVQIFRRSEEAPAVVDDAIRVGAKVVWMQLGVTNPAAAQTAEKAGLDVVMDRCPKIEYGRLFGEIGWAGVNRRVISSKKGRATQLSAGTTRAAGTTKAKAPPTEAPAAVRSEHPPSRKRAKKPKAKGASACANTVCPWTGAPVSAAALMPYRGQLVGFADPELRDRFASALDRLDGAIAATEPPKKKGKHKAKKKT